MKSTSTRLGSAQSRRSFIKATAQTGVALTAVSLYDLVDSIARPPARLAFADSQPFPLEQHVMQNVAVIMDDGSGTSSSNGTIAIIVPPLHHAVVTAKLKVKQRSSDLKEAQVLLERALQRLESQYAPTPAGLGIAFAWSLSYFRHYLPVLKHASPFFPEHTRYPDYLPIDNRASQAAGAAVRAIQEAIVFPSDQPPANFPKVRLEQNDVAVLLRSDSLAHINDGIATLFGENSGQAGELFKVMSIRRGFAGGGFYGAQSLPCKMAVAAHIPAAHLIPTNAELLMGFTSTHQAAIAPGVIANMECSPGLTDQWPNGYFQHGTAMHLSHVFEDLESWYEGTRSVNFSHFSDRVRAAFRPGVNVPDGTRTISEGAADVENEQAVQRDLQTFGAVGHSSSMQPTTRLLAPMIDNYGNAHAAGTPLLLRADADTLDNPFFYSADPVADRYSPVPAAGLTFVGFTATSDAFHRMRLSMDGHYPDGTVLNLDSRSFGMGFNSVLFTTHRQNFLLPPRSHRSFPLAELL
jgi:hypothetical protein